MARRRPGTDCAVKYQHSCRSCYSGTGSKPRQLKLHRAICGGPRKRTLRRVVYGRPRKANLVLPDHIRFQIYEYWRVRLDKERVRRQTEAGKASNLPIQCSDATSDGHNAGERVVALNCLVPWTSAAMVCPPINVKIPGLDCFRLETRQPLEEEEDAFVSLAIECTEKETRFDLTRLVCGLLGCNTDYLEAPCYCSYTC